MATTPTDFDGTTATQRPPHTEFHDTDITPKVTRDFGKVDETQRPLLDNVSSALSGLSTGVELAWSWSTETLSLTSSMPGDWLDAEEFDLQPPPVRTEIETTRDKRLTLLARKYEGRSLVVEEEARLKLLTERLRRLVPRVTEEDWEQLTDIAENAVAFDDRHDEIRKRLGLDR